MHTGLHARPPAFNMGWSQWVVLALGAVLVSVGEAADIAHVCGGNDIVCLHGGSCVQRRDATSICLCADGYSGQYCENVVDRTRQRRMEQCGTQCQNGATCEAGQSGYICLCSAPWVGTHCDELPEGLFVSTWKTDNQGTSNATQVMLPLEYVGTYNFTVHWGDEVFTDVTSYPPSGLIHTYAAAGSYDIYISGTIDGYVTA